MKMTNNYIIRLEEEKDFQMVENLTREAFWNVYHPGCTEHYVLHKFRNNKDFIHELDFVMEIDGEIMGHIMYARSEIQANKKISIATFGPVSISPKYQHKGYGKALVEYSLQKAKEYGIKAVAITGNIDFYGKVGFVVASTKGIRYDGASAEDEVVPYFIIKELEAGFLDNITGTYSDPEGYFVAEQNPVDFEKYDNKFPKKEKLRLPGQLG